MPEREGCPPGGVALCNRVEKGAFARATRCHRFNVFFDDIVVW